MIKFDIYFHLNTLNLLVIHLHTGCSLNIVFFPLPVLLQRWCSTCHMAVQAWSPVYTYWHRGKTEKVQSPEYIENPEKNTIFNEHPIHADAGPSCCMTGRTDLECLHVREGGKKLIIEMQPNLKRPPSPCDYHLSPFLASRWRQLKIYCQLSFEGASFSVW